MTSQRDGCRRISGRTVGAILGLCSCAACASSSHLADLTRGIEISGPALASQSVRAGALQRDLAEVGALVMENEERLQTAGSLVALAEQRVAEAEQMARGRLAQEVVYQLEGVRFEAGSSELTSDSEHLLDQLAERLLAEDVGYYLEVYGQADRPADDAASLRLGQARAEAVRRYLHLRHGLPLRRITAVARDAVPPPPNDAVGWSDPPTGGQVALRVLREVAGGG